MTLPWVPRQPKKQVAVTVSLDVRTCLTRIVDSVVIFYTRDRYWYSLKVKHPLALSHIHTRLRYVHLDIWTYISSQFSWFVVNYFLPDLLI